MKEINCPCCGEVMVEEYEICSVCGWENDPVQAEVATLRGANRMTLKEAKEAYSKGVPVK